jgi:hypothetical protein
MSSSDRPSLPVRARHALAAAMIGGALLGGAGAIATAQIYTWTDEQGRRQISDRPPEGGVKDLKVQGRVAPGPAPAAPTAAAAGKGEERKGPQSVNEKALEFNKRAIEREEARAKQEKSEAEARERAQRCEQAQAYVRNLQQGGRATRLNPKTGEREFLEGAARDQELADAQRTAESWCKPPAPAPAAPAAPAKK